MCLLIRLISEGGENMNFASDSTDEKSLLEHWIQEYGDAVLRMCVVYLNDQSIAEDATQDTFLKVWKNRKRFHGEDAAAFKAWIMRIAINTCKDYRRTSWFRQRQPSLSLENIPPSLHPVEEMDRNLFLDVLSLPNKEKQAVLLYYYQDMTLQQAASVLGISPPALLRRLKKAYTLLRFQPEGSELR